MLAGTSLQREPCWLPSEVEVMMALEIVYKEEVLNDREG
jgi:hypothetical protein